MDAIGILLKLLAALLISLAAGLSGYRILKVLLRSSLDAANPTSDEPSNSGMPPGNHQAAENSHSFFQVTTLTFANRALIFLVAYCAYLGIANQPAGFLSTFQEIWGKWDARSYLYIAENGYPTEGDAKFLLVFYPLYPLTIRLMHFAVGSYFGAAIAVSLASLFAATYYLYQLVLIEFPAAVARDTVKYILIFPFSFFFSAAYAESLFLLLSVLTFYFCKRDRWFAAGIAGMLAALTRNHGVLLFLPLAVELLYRHRCRKSSAIGTIRRTACVLLVPLGSGIYLCMNKWLSGEWLMFVRYQNENWDNGLGFFAENLQAYFLGTPHADIRMMLGTWIPELFIFFTAAIFIAAAARKVSPSYIAYSVAYLVISYSPTYLLSGARYITAMFPFFICMAVVVRGHYIRQQLLDVVSFSLLGLYICMYPQIYTIY